MDVGERSRWRASHCEGAEGLKLLGCLCWFWKCVLCCCYTTLRLNPPRTDDGRERTVWQHNFRQRPSPMQASIYTQT